jgi:hypothetical protein
MIREACSQFFRISDVFDVSFLVRRASCSHGCLRVLLTLFGAKNGSIFVLAPDFGMGGGQQRKMSRETKHTK